MKERLRTIGFLIGLVVTIVIVVFLLCCVFLLDKIDQQWQLLRLWYLDRKISLEWKFVRFWARHGYARRAQKWADRAHQALNRRDALTSELGAPEWDYLLFHY